jgi:dTDP-glucose 4,6-dehydratase
MNRLLVTGGAGFIGVNFVNYWLACHTMDRVVVLDALTYAGNRKSLADVQDNPLFRFVHGDIRNQALVEKLLREEEIDTIVHFAAESHVDRSIQGPDPFIESNIIGTYTLLKAAERVWLDNGPIPHRFHHISTDEVFGSLGPDDPAFTESTPYAPNSPYSASKAASDHLVRAYHHTYGLNITISNCSNNYGPYQFPEKLIPLLLLNILEARPLPIYGDGMNIRDWLYVEDHCRGIELILKQGEPGEVYNMGGNNERTNIEIARLLCMHVDRLFAEDQALRKRYPRAAPARGERSERLIAYVEDRPGHDWRYAINTAKISKRLGFAPAESFETGLAKTVQWYLGHEHWWRSIRRGEHIESEC